MGEVSYVAQDNFLFDESIRKTSGSENRMRQTMRW